ncbi:MAG: hypothetical protein ACREFZ_11965 [Acetobacteraceae bacterium]
MRSIGAGQRVEPVDAGDGVGEIARRAQREKPLRGGFRLVTYPEVTRSGFPASLLLVTT